MPSCKFLTLPTELIIYITTFQAVPDILSLRLTHPSFSQICDSPLEDRRFRLYLHPKSIVHAIDFLSSNTATKWRENIEQVIVLGNCEPEMKTRSGENEIGRKLDFHVWDYTPRSADVGESAEMGYDELVQIEGRGFRENYDGLLVGLKRLPNLKVLKYAGSVEDVGIGFCGVSDETVRNHAKGRDNWQLKFGGEGQPRLRQALKTVWWGDADVFASVLDVVGDVVARVEILQPMPAVHGFWKTNSRQARGEAVRSVKITAIGQAGWEDYLTGLFGSMAGIETWEVDIQTQFEEEQMNWRRNFPWPRKRILWEEDERDMRCGHGLLELSSNIRKLSIRCWSGRYPSGLREGYLRDFMAQHKSSLTAVEFYNILPFEVDMEGLIGAGIWPEYDIDAGIWDIVDCMTTHMRLEKAVLMIPRLGCVDGCLGFEHDPGCGVYPTEEGYQRVEILDDFAKKSGTELSDGWWDFAEKVVST